MQTQFDRQDKVRFCFLVERGLTLEEIAVEFKMSVKEFMDLQEKIIFGKKSK